ncbi:ABC transporter permease [Comamonas odontotermitis]|uniref:ABC transporter permease n=1 Tax=Comamonas odontotermitis TaxID=379895 RepID=UPI003752B3BD
MNWEVIFQPDTLALYGEGLITTLKLLIASLAIGAVLALLGALALVSRSWILRKTVGAFTYFMRGTPLLIQVYLIYYGFSQLEWVQARWDAVWPWTYFKEPFFCAFLAFTLNTAAYTAEMLAGSIRETSKGEVEAARAMGMSRWQLMRRVVMPSAIRRTLPAYSNEVVMMLHSTSLASTVPSLVDLTGAASRVYSDYYLPFEAYIAAAVVYLCITFILIGLFRIAEHHFLGYLAPRKA